MSTIHEKLVAIQSELKAPKGQTNAFGKYKYRSCEDILEALKPLLAKEKLFLTLNDEIVEVAGRVYVKAVALIGDGEQSIAVAAFARESLDKKGMDDAQITGAASSYARKYALNGLFCIDYTKDADTHDNRKETKTSVGDGVLKTWQKKMEAAKTKEEMKVLSKEIKALKLPEPEAAVLRDIYMTEYDKKSA